MAGHKTGFTLVEALMGSLILAVGAVVICGLSHRCMYNQRRGMEYEQAYRLLDECLDKVVATWAVETTHNTTLQGDFAPRYPAYSYTVQLEPSELGDNLCRVTARVSWQVQSDEYDVQATTLVYDRN